MEAMTQAELTQLFDRAESFARRWADYFNALIDEGLAPDIARVMTLNCAFGFGPRNQETTA